MAATDEKVKNDPNRQRKVCRIEKHFVALYVNIQGGLVWSALNVDNAV